MAKILICSIIALLVLAAGPADAAPQPVAKGATSSAASAAASKRGQAIALYNARDFRGAALILEPYIYTNPRDAYAAYYAAMANQQMGNSGKAVIYYKMVCTTAPTSQIAGYAKSILSKLDPAFAATLTNIPSPSNVGGKSTSGGSGGGGGGDGDAAPAFDPSLPGECRVHFERGGRQIFLDTYINDRHIKMLFDTGAPDTCIGKNQMSEIGLPIPGGPPAGTTGGSSSSAEVEYWQVKAKIKVGQIEKKDITLTVLEHNSADPLLGQEFFRNFDYTIDQGAGEIVFRQKAISAKNTIRNAVDVPFVFKKDGNRIIVNVTINGKTGPVMFDSGNTASALSFFNAAEAAKFGLKVPEDAGYSRHGGVNGEGSCRTFYVSRIQLGPVDRSNIEVSVNEGTDKNDEGLPLLGQPFWAGFEYTIDMANKVIHFVRR